MTRADGLDSSAHGAHELFAAQDAAADTGEFTEKPLILAPAHASEWPAFRATLRAWRHRERARLGLDLVVAQAEPAWAARAFCCALVMLTDQLLLDPARGALDAGRLLVDARGFGGLDCVVLWPAYPRIGVDARNQFDCLREQPGGLEGLRALVEQLHAAGVRVLLPYLPWDTGTRREGMEDAEALARMVDATGADGLFLDTVSRAMDELRPRLDALRPDLVLASELALEPRDLPSHQLSWAQWFLDGRAPGVLRNKWLDRRHMQHQVWRWDDDHTAEIQSAWMNGSGVMVWENVFGTWAGWSARDRSLLRTVLPIQRRFADLFCGPGWTPLVPTLHPDVYASAWEDEDRTVWTLVNRSESWVEGELLAVDARPEQVHADLVAGRRVEAAPAEDDVTRLRGVLPPRGVGCFLAAGPKALGEDFEAFLSAQVATAAARSLDATPPRRTAALRPVAPAPVATPPAGTVAVPGRSFTLRVDYRVRECGLYGSRDADVRLATLHQPATTSRDVAVGPFAMDEVPVTNAAYAAFVASTGYAPAHPERFLAHFVDGRPAPGTEQHPVVWVDLDDARAYARWAGRRLATEEEWQHAAQGVEERRWPWGDAWEPGRCNGGEHGATTRVDAFWEGRSPFGVLDLCGNAWEWTESERDDGRTRSCIIRGGSHHRARGSIWYADGGPLGCRWASRLLLSWAGADRFATIGFRCVADLPS